MKRLLILRHAQALPADASGKDIARKLSPKGVGDAQALGREMAKRGLMPEAVLCSPAVRTRDTLSAVMETLPIPHVSYPEPFYNAPPGVLLAGVQQAETSIQTLLIVAHNPGVHGLAAMLADETSPAIDRLMGGYAPASLCVFECDIGMWSEIQVYENTLIDVLESVEYNGEQRPTRWM